MAGIAGTCLVCGRSFISPRGRRCCSLHCTFWSYVDRSGGPDACWPWMGHISPTTGYGDVPQLLGEDGKRSNSHRLAWRLANATDPGLLCVLHRCDVRRCCNPAHLFLGTKRANLWDACAKGRVTVIGFGEGHPKSKLTNIAVCLLRSGEMTEGDINAMAKRYGVKLRTIHNARAGRTWKHLPFPAPLEAEHHVQQD